MPLLIEQLINQNYGHDKIAEEQLNGIFEAVQQGQALVEIGEDFLKNAQEAAQEGVDSEHLVALGNDLIGIGERMCGGLGKMAAETYDVSLDYADMACDLYDIAGYMEEMNKTAQNEVLAEYIKVATEICGGLIDEIGEDYVNQVYMEKKADYSSDAKALARRHASGELSNKQYNSLLSTLNSNEVHETKRITSGIKEMGNKRLVNKIVGPLWGNRSNGGKAGVIAAAAAALGTAGYGIHRLKNAN